jgi:hypothetical protein
VGRVEKSRLVLEGREAVFGREGTNSVGKTQLLEFLNPNHSPSSNSNLTY